MLETRCVLCCIHVRWNPTQTQKASLTKLGVCLQPFVYFSCLFQAILRKMNGVGLIIFELLWTITTCIPTSVSERLNSSITETIRFREFIDLKSWNKKGQYTGLVLELI